MKKLMVAFILLVAFLAVFIPLASVNPDGLEKVVQSFGAKRAKTNLGRGDDGLFAFVH